MVHELRRYDVSERLKVGRAESESKHLFGEALRLSRTRSSRRRREVSSAPQRENPPHSGFFRIAQSTAFRPKDKCILFTFSRANLTDPITSVRHTTLNFVCKGTTRVGRAQRKQNGVGQWYIRNSMPRELKRFDENERSKGGKVERGLKS